MKRKQSGVKKSSYTVSLPSGLPCEVLIRLFSKLNIKELISLFFVSKEMYQILTKNTDLANAVWKKLLMFYFPVLYRIHKEELQLIATERVAKGGNKRKARAQNVEDQSSLGKVFSEGGALSVIPSMSTFNTGMSSVYYSVFVGCCICFTSKKHSEKNELNKSINKLFFCLKDSSLAQLLSQMSIRKAKQILLLESMLNNGLIPILLGENKNELGSVFKEIEKTTKKNWIKKNGVKVYNYLTRKNKDELEKNSFYWPVILNQKEEFELKLDNLMDGFPTAFKRLVPQKNENFSSYSSLAHVCNFFRSELMPVLIKCGNTAFIEKLFNKLEQYFYSNAVKIGAINFLCLLIDYHQTTLAKSFFLKWKNKIMNKENIEALFLTAIEAGNVEMVRLLVEKCDVNINLEYTSKGGCETALLLAAENKKQVIVEFLIKKSDILIIKPRFENERTALFYIIKEWGGKFLIPLLKKINVEKISFSADLFCLIELYTGLKRVASSSAIKNPCNDSVARCGHPKEMNILLFDERYNYKKIRSEKMADLIDSMDLLITRGYVDFMHKPNNKTVAELLSLDHSALYKKLSKLSQTTIDFYYQLSEKTKEVSSSEKYKNSGCTDIEKMATKKSDFCFLGESVRDFLIQGKNKSTLISVEKRKAVEKILCGYPGLKKAYENLKQQILNRNKKRLSFIKSKVKVVKLSGGPKL